MSSSPVMLSRVASAHTQSHSEMRESVIFLYEFPYRTDRNLLLPLHDTVVLFRLGRHRMSSALSWLRENARRIGLMLVVNLRLKPSPKRRGRPVARLIQLCTSRFVPLVNRKPNRPMDKFIAAAARTANRLTDDGYVRVYVNVQSPSAVK